MYQTKEEQTTLTKEQINRAIMDEKIKQLNKKELEDKYSNNFTILEPNYYDIEDINYKKESRLQTHGFSLVRL